MFKLMILFIFLINLFLVNYNLLYKYSKKNIIINIITFIICLIISLINSDTMKYLFGMLFFSFIPILSYFFFRNIPEKQFEKIKIDKEILQTITLSFFKFQIIMCDIIFFIVLFKNFKY